jgi:hypothetical protein
MSPGFKDLLMLAIAPLRTRARVLRILFPCGGIDAPGLALDAMQLPYENTGFWDLDDKYGPSLRFWS